MHFLSTVVIAAAAVAVASADDNVSVGPRPFYLIDNMDEGALKKELQSCSVTDFKKSDFSIGHRGAPLQFAEHSKESYMASARLGAGVIECDVTFTKDKELVCRHSQCDLHTTTNILLTPLASKCQVGWTAPVKGVSVAPKCCTSDITLKEFKTLCAKMDAGDATATTVEGYVNGATPKFRTELYAGCGTLMTHKESIELIRSLGRKFVPEIKKPDVPLPLKGPFTQAMYVQKVIDEYKQAGVSPKDVWVQSFEYPDILQLIKTEPEFAKQAVLLDDEIDLGVDKLPGGKTLKQYLQDYKKAGVNIIAPAYYALVTVKNGKVVPSQYAIEAKAAGLDIITWSFERAPPIKRKGAEDFYYKSVTSVMNNDGDTVVVLDVLARQVGIIGIFSDWPAMVSYYWNCILRDDKKDDSGKGKGKKTGGKSRALDTAWI